MGQLIPPPLSLPRIGKKEEQERPSYSSNKNPPKGGTDYATR